MWLLHSPFLYVAGLILVSLLAIPWFRHANRTQNLHGFVFPGWMPVADQPTVFAIEESITQGPLMTVLGLDGLSVTESHSHLKAEHSQAYTGMIGLFRTFTGNQRTAWQPAGRLHLNELGGRFRYFLFHLPGRALPPLHLRTENLGLALQAPYDSLQPELQELERICGSSGWDLLVGKGTLLVICTELNGPAKNEEFLACCKKMAVKLG